MLSPRPLLPLLLLLGGVLASCGQAPGDEASAPAAGDVDREAWARVLSEHAREGGVDYAALQASRSDLDAYLASLAEARPRELAPAEEMAFWINAYNAVVIGHVLDRYPGIVSVKQEEGFFDRLTFPVAGEQLTLDEIETRGLDLGEPRVHFAVVCASTSCPDLLAEPYRGADLERQLGEQTRLFLADPTKGMRYDGETGTLWLSSIFKWYAGDFTGGSTVVAFFARGGVADWVRAQLPDEAAAEIKESAKVRYLEYDWSLNDRPRR